uniref:Uncharacterized protein n=1 Tax=Rhizophora mucronata TaxID=61149 RepID=A0A2P2QQW0_RHIMU
MMVPANAFWMIPQPATATAGPSSNQQSQIWALLPSTITPVFNVAAAPAARPIASLMASTTNGNNNNNIPSGVDVRGLAAAAAASSPAVVTSTSVGPKLAKKSTMGGAMT